MIVKAFAYTLSDLSVAKKGKKRLGHINLKEMPKSFKFMKFPKNAGSRMAEATNPISL